MRTANLDKQVAGIDIPESSKVLCVPGSAEMDPDKWGDPEIFRLDRKPQGHLAFGGGVLGCVGQNVARAGMEAVLARKVARMEVGESRFGVVETPYTRSTACRSGYTAPEGTFD